LTMDLTTFIDNFHLLAEAPNGIPKLREMILQLAVRGKLVPQDSNGEPASELLKKITAEKARLIAEGKIKRSNSLPPIDQDEVPYELPEGWEWVRLDDLCSYIQRGKGPKYVDKSAVPVISQKCIQWSGFKIDLARFIDLDSLKNYGLERFLRNGDLLWNSTGTGTIGRVTVYDHDSTDFDTVVADSHVTVVRPVFVNPYYLFNYIASPVVQDGFEERMSGTTNQIELNTTTARTHLIPLPPLAEQKRIVAKLDELIALCDELEEQKKRREQVSISMNNACLHELTSSEPATSQKGWSRIQENFDLLYYIPDNVAALRKSILQLAVMGKLVPQEPMDLPAPQSGKFYVYALECEDKSIYVGQTDDVLKKWKEHAAGKGAEWTRMHPPVRLVHWEEYDSREEAVQREKELKTEFGRKWIKRELAAGRTRQAGEPASVLLKKIATEKERLVAEGKLKKSKPLPPIGQDEVPYALPKGWEWIRLGLAYDVRDGTHDTPKYVEKGFPLVTSKNIYNGCLDLTNIKYISEVDHLAISVRSKVERDDILFAMIGSIGNPVLVDTDKKFSIKNVALFKYYDRLISEPKYLNTFLKHAANEMRTSALGGVQSFVSLAYLRNYTIPIAPLAEQKRIVAKVDELMALCDELEVKLKQSSSVTEMLMAAIVNKVTQW
jgi:restriction endonuclease S subunit